MRSAPVQSALMQLVGRDSELDEVLARLENRRLVTVTGPGGIGKTALAHSAAPDAPMVDLTLVDSADAVEDAFAGQLGYRDFAGLVDGWIGGGLVVVDNCEHVLDAAAAAVSRMLTVPAVRVLATSRTPLDLPEESVVVVGPLDAHGSDFVESVEVFIRAAVDAGVEPTSLEGDEVVEVCRLLDGIPLALEIAAARLRTMSVPELRSVLESDLASLVRPRYRGRRAHAGIAEMVIGSVALLDDPHLFESLGVFAGPFTADAAAAVSGIPPAAARDGLDELVHGSLLVTESGPALTFRMLHPVRAVALDRLRAAGRFDDASNRYCDHAVDLAARIIEASHEGWEASVLGRLLTSYRDLAGAVRWALEHDSSPDRAFVLLTVLWGVIHQIHAEEVEALGTRALERWREPDGRRSDVVSTVATCRILLGDPAGAGSLILDTLPLSADVSYATCTLQRALAQAHRATGRLPESRDAFLEAARVADTLGAAGLAMESRVGYAMLRSELGEADQALEIIETEMQRARSSGATINLAWAMTTRAAVLYRLGRPEVRAAEESLELSRQLEYPAGIVTSLRVLAMSHLGRGDEPAAVEVLGDLLEELRRRGMLSDMRLALDLVAEIAESHDDPAWRDLATTAAHLPVTTVSAPVHHRLFDTSDGRVLSVRDAFLLATRTLDRIVRPGTATAGEGPSLSRRGDMWSVSFGGETVSIRATKGMDDLAELLARPDQEVAAVDLMGAAVAGEGTDELIDAAARQRYMARVRELQEDIDDAERFGDSGRAEKARLEMEALVEHLAAATGLGGRTRRTSSSGERARSAVTHRIRSTVSRLGELHPGLGRHLEVSVVTGVMCAYRPETPTRWRIER